MQQVFKPQNFVGKTIVNVDGYEDGNIFIFNDDTFAYEVDGDYDYGLMGMLLDNEDEDGAEEMIALGVISRTEWDLKTKEYEFKDEKRELQEYLRLKKKFEK